LQFENDFHFNTSQENVNIKMKIIFTFPKNHKKRFIRSNKKTGFRYEET